MSWPVSIIVMLLYFTLWGCSYRSAAVAIFPEPYYTCHLLTTAPSPTFGELSRANKKAITLGQLSPLYPVGDGVGAEVTNDIAFASLVAPRVAQSCLLFQC